MSVAGVLLAIVVVVLAGMVVGLVTGILAWMRDSSLPVSERAAGAFLRGGAACGAAILLALAILAAAGVLR
jgi:hypothetical protein